MSVDIYRSLPLSILQMLDGYLETSLFPGSAMGAVLRNDLFGTMRHGDTEFLDHLRLLVRYLDNCVPYATYGSPARVSSWLEMRDTGAREAYLSKCFHREYMATRKRDRSTGLTA